MNKPSLYFLRHGLAVERGAAGYEDSQRPLLPKGIKEVKRVAKALKRMKLKPDIILTSPYLRAAHTAEITGKILKAKRKILFSLSLVPSAKFTGLFKDIRKLIRKYPEILLVGHEPHLSAFISYLISGNTKARFILKKSGLCKIVYKPKSFSPGTCSLAWFLPPDQLTRL